MKAFTIALFCVVIASISSFSVNNVYQEEWKTFKLKYGKNYNEYEDKIRFSIFLENIEKIVKHNQLYYQDIKPFKMGVNQFADMHFSEFVSTMNGYKVGIPNNYEGESVTYIEPEDLTLPKEVDWRQKGAVTPVHDQGTCGSCWAFAAAGSLEAQHFRKTGKLINLSVQNLVDCTYDYGNRGCGGGTMANAYRYIKVNHGVDTEESYPYTGWMEDCYFNATTIGATDKGYVNVTSFSETALQKAVATIGPISVAIDAGNPSLQFYESGVYEDKECSSTMLNHGVLVVGYGTTQNGTDYWLVKNSWGETWGEKGYIQMRRNFNNMCGIATNGSYPLV